MDPSAGLHFIVMNWDQVQMIITFTVVVGAFVALMREWLPADLVALGGMALLLATGVLGEDDLRTVFSNPAPMTIGAMFVLGEALTRTGAIDWIARHFGTWAGKSMSRALVILALIVIPLSAFMNNTPVVIVFLPVLMAFSRSSGLKASKLLIPLSFLGILGGTITLIGTSTNLLVAGVAKQHGQPPFGIFEISGLGLIYAVVGFLYLYFIGRHLLPVRDTVSSLLDAEDTRRFCSAVEISEDSPLAGVRLIEHPLFSDQKRVLVYEVIRHGRRVDDIPLDALVIQERDVYLFRATSKWLAEIRASKGVTMLHDKMSAASDDSGDVEVKTVEAIIGSQSSLVGRSVRESGIRRRFGVVVAAVHRKGVNLKTGYQDVRLAFGDTILLEGPIHNLVQLQQEGDFLSLNEMVVTVPRTSKVAVAVGIMVAVVLCAAFNVLSITSAAVIGAVLAVATRCLDMRECYRSIEWNILFLIYGMLGLGLAMENTGGAALVANQVVGMMSGTGPWMILAVIYLLAWVLTEMVTNNAVAILLTPVVISIAATLDVDPRPFIVAVMFGASASFSTPIGYQTNTYVYGAGGYRFSDFTKVGLPLNLILWGVAVFFIPRIWPF